MRPVLVVTLLSALVVVGQASGKEIQSATVCGQSGCAQGKDGSQLEWLAQVGDGTGPPSPAPFYTVKVVVAEPDGKQLNLRSLYVPSQGKVGAKPDGSNRVEWFNVLPQYASALDRAAPRVRPYPTARFPRAPTSLTPKADLGSRGIRVPALLIGLGLIALCAATALTLYTREHLKHRFERRNRLAPQR